jgi:hypothetical protein
MHNVLSAGKKEWAKCVLVCSCGETAVPRAMGPYACLPAPLLPMLLVASPGPQDHVNYARIFTSLSYLVMARGMSNVDMGVLITR